MAAPDRIRLIGLLTKSPAPAGLFHVAGRAARALHSRLASALARTEVDGDRLSFVPTYEVSTSSRAGVAAVWDAWTDVARWSDSEHIESARVDGTFRSGAVITSKAKGLPRSTLTVTRVQPPTLWVDESASPGVRMVFDHVIESRADGTVLTERVVIGGPLGPLVGPLLRRRLEALFAASVAHVARTAEAAEAAAGEPAP